MVSPRSDPLPWFSRLACPFRPLSRLFASISRSHLSPKLRLRGAAPHRLRPETPTKMGDAATPGRRLYMRPPTHLLDGIRERDALSAALSRPQPNQNPLPPPQLAAYQDADPYQAHLPDMAWLAHCTADASRAPVLRWLTTMVYSLAAALVPLAQLLAAATPSPATTSNMSDLLHSDQHREPGEPQLPHRRCDQHPLPNRHHDFALAEAAEHLRHVARLVQQLAAALADNLDHDTRPDRPASPEEEC